MNCKVTNNKCTGNCHITHLYTPGFSTNKCSTCGWFDGDDGGEETFKINKMEQTTFHPVAANNDGKFNTASGIVVDLINPTPDMITLNDIASALSKICRFGGQISRFYSVAQHCCIVHAMASQDVKKEALLHDAAEAYLGDVIKPLKVMLNEYHSIESRFEATIAQKFGLNAEKLKAVKVHDMNALEIEHEYLQKGDANLWHSVMRTLGFSGKLWTPETARHLFIKTFNFYC